MKSPHIFATAALTSVLCGCATNIRVPEIPLFETATFEPARLEPEPQPLVQYVEVPKPLPLPGQLKPVQKDGEKQKDERAPKDRVAGANAAARLEPL